MGRLLGPDFPNHLALAVSGGGDSMAMLHLAAPWARVMGITLWPVTVDHGLRAESAAEAAFARRACQQLGLAHTTLLWQWDGQGNLQESAREARLALMNRWRRGIEHIAFAHTEDDLAETFLLRLARGSGAEGLAAMADSRTFRPHAGNWTVLAPEEVVADADPPIPTRRVAGVPAYSPGFKVVRPLLTTGREELRHFLRVLKIQYVDDPSNDDPRFERVKMRRALPALAELGLTKERLAATARHLGETREALAQRALAAHGECRVKGERMQFDVIYDRDIFARIERDTQLRLLAAALQYVSHEPRRPRRTPLEEALDRALSGGATTIHGGYIYPHRERLYICAEYARVADIRVENSKWRGLFVGSGQEIRALGPEGAAQLRDQTDLPARVLWPCPAVWDGDTVLSTPRLGYNPHWNPEIPMGRLERLFTSR